MFDPSLVQNDFIFEYGGSTSCANCFPYQALTLDLCLVRGSEV